MKVFEVTDEPQLLRVELIGGSPSVMVYVNNKPMVYLREFNLVFTVNVTEVRFELFRRTDSNLTAIDLYGNPHTYTTHGYMPKFDIKENNVIEGNLLSQNQYDKYLIEGK